MQEEVARAHDFLIRLQDGRNAFAFQDRGSDFVLPVSGCGSATGWLCHSSQKTNKRKRPRARSAAVLIGDQGQQLAKGHRFFGLAFIRNHCLHLCCTISRLIITDHKCCFFQGKGQYGGTKSRRATPATTTLQNYSALNQSSALSQVSWSISSIRSLSVLAPPITERPLAPA